MIEINNPWGKQESCIFQHVIYQNGNVLRLTLVFRIILKWLTLKICQTTSEEKTQSSWNVGVWTILTTSCTHWVFFRPRYCFRYLAIRMKYYFNIICQCFSVLPFPATTNNKPKAQPNRKCSWYSSKVKILGSQPDVVSLIWIDHMFIVPIFNWDLAHIL